MGGRYIKLKSNQIHLASRLQRVNMLINFITQVIPKVECVIFCDVCVCVFVSRQQSTCPLGNVQAGLD